jgi:hypothetical protein
LRERRTIGEARWPASGEFVALAKAWQPDAVTRLLGFVWAAYDLLCAEVLAQVDRTQADRDLERSVTQYLEPRIHKVMPPDSPFYVQHGPYEFETAKKPPAQPPSPDIGFVLRENPRLMMPLEAKTLKTDQAVDEYVTAIHKNFLTCRYGPFSTEGGMLGYLVAGDPAQAFDSIAVRVPCELRTHPSFPDRDHRTSDHERTVPPGKSYPRAFRCHHLILRLANTSPSIPPAASPRMAR